MRFRKHRVRPRVSRLLQVIATILSATAASSSRQLTGHCGRLAKAKLSLEKGKHRDDGTGENQKYSEQIRFPGALDSP
jgi:hypothetical protein